MKLHDNPLLSFRRTKIVATIGPASSQDSMIKVLLQAGVNVFRVNFSHGERDEQAETIRRIHRAADEEKKTVAVLADLAGPKIRVGTFQGGAVTLHDGMKVRITANDIEGTETLIPSQYKEILHDLRPEAKILLDDGNLELKVTEILKDTAEAVVVHGGILKNKKGMNLPGTAMSVQALTDKDRADIPAIIAADADFIALSFVRSAEDVRLLKGILSSHGSDMPVIAKIEKPEALDNIESIIDTADGIMVARGDLGVEVPSRKIPLIEKELIALANARSKPVIVATQMLESMIEHPRPTRAEVTDVAFACFSGTDAVMLSAETAVGRYPVESVTAMDSILREIEARQYHEKGFGTGNRTDPSCRDEVTEAISSASAAISRDLKVKAILALTRTGYTARISSSERPFAPVIALAHSQTIMRRLCLSWGVLPFRIGSELRFHEYVDKANTMVQELGLAGKGDYIIILSGVSDKNLGTNAIYIHRVG